MTRYEPEGGTPMIRILVDSALLAIAIGLGSSVGRLLTDGYPLSAAITALITGAFIVAFVARIRNR
jgi:hypothetical protein